MSATITERKVMVSPRPLVPVPLTRAPPGYVFVADPDEESKAATSDLHSTDAKVLPKASPPSTSTTVATPAPMKSLGLKALTCKIGASYQLAATSTAGINALVTNQLLLTLTDFLSMSAVFDEFFIDGFHVHYQPANRYSGIFPSSNPSTTYLTYPLAVVRLHHDTPNYANHSIAVNNGWFQHKNSADPWTYDWVNVEKKSSTVLQVAAGGEYATQSWARNTSLLTYTGAVQIISPFAAFGGADFLAGNTSVEWKVSFRSRK